jgi:hypothetical protein
VGVRFDLWDVVFEFHHCVANIFRNRLDVVGCGCAHIIDGREGILTAIAWLQQLLFLA